MTIEIDAHARPVEPRRHLLDVRRLAGAVVALDHHAAVVFEAGENGERDVTIEEVVRIDIRHVLVGLGVGWNLEVAVDSEDLPHRQFHVWQIAGLRARQRLVSCAYRVNSRSLAPIAVIGSDRCELGADAHAAQKWST